MIVFCELFSVHVYVSVVYSLRQRCMQVVRDVMSLNEIQDADIPETLREDIVQSYVQPAYSEYAPSHH